MNTNKNYTLSTIAGLVLLIAALLYFPGTMHSGISETNETVYSELAENPINKQVDPTETLKNLNNALANIAEIANPAVVTIKSKQKVRVRQIDPFAQFFGRPNSRYQDRVREGLGSGVIISSDGYILTNNHVVEDADELLIGLLNSDEEVEAEIVGTDPQTDIAVLKVDMKDLPTLKLGDSDKMRVGEIVIAVGSPLSEGLAHTVTMGIVSARGRANLQLAEYEDFIQTDAAINPGNSGGALVNLNGELIGINTAIASRSGGNQGIGFSIPINMAKNVMDQLIKYGKVSRGYIGIYMQDVNSKMAKALDLETSDGVIINQVEPNSPASRAKLKDGDIIIGYEGEKVENSLDLRSRVAQTRPGSKVKVEILRDGKKKNFTLVLDEKDGGIAENGESKDDMNSLLGFDFSELNRELAYQYRINDDLSGVIVTSIDARSSAYRNGLREGDVITKVNRTQIENASDFEKIAGKLEKGDTIVLRIVRKDAQIYLAIDL